jgi:hypothetical protein
VSKIHKCAVEKLHPTQISVGMIEVHDKRRYLRELGYDERRDYLEAHPIPAVLGPGERLYITDHHHLGRALHDENIEHGFFLVEEAFAALDREEFWQRMEARHWVHPVDAEGRRRNWNDIPQHLKDLVDDPYRSLAGYVRAAGGFLKSDIAFAEFAWADFFRKRIVIEPGLDGFDQAVRAAIPLAHSEQARGLPGYVRK